jgi:phosphopentomutase
MPPAAPNSARGGACARRFVVIVLDGVGVGALPDASRFGDEGTNTLLHTAEAVGALELPTLRELGLGNVQRAPGLEPVAAPRASWGRMAERSPDKDTQSGHWEMMGCPLLRPFAHYPNGFPKEIIGAFCGEAGIRGVLGNKPASGTEILKELGAEHERTGLPIVYTSGDSVFQVAAHVEVVPLETLYRWCGIARRILDNYRVGRVIARPFTGRDGNYTRTFDRRDYSMPPPGPTVLDVLKARGVPIVGIGKIGDIFVGKGLTESVHTEGNRDGMRATLEAARRLESGLVFTNLVEFDSHFGHRRDPAGMARALRDFDQDLAPLVEELRPGDRLIVSADHGNDPTFTKTTDHTREYVPLLVYAPGETGRALGVRGSFCDIGATVADAFGARGAAGGAAAGCTTAGTALGGA